MDKKVFAVALDGPAGAGKSSIAKKISEKANIVYMDTGAIYRTFAYKAIKEGVDTKDVDALTKLAEDIDIKIEYVDNQQHMILDGEDITPYIRTPEVSMGASNVAVVPAVRLKLLDLQRDVAKVESVIMDGRDIGSFVLPDAEVKVYLTASVEERARRRFVEMQEKGDCTDTLEIVIEDIKKRDYQDSHRDFAPLVQADDAVVVDSTSMTIDEVVDSVYSLIEEKVYNA